MDKARNRINKHLTKLEKSILLMYRQAQSRIRYNWDAYLGSIKNEGDSLLNDYEDALLSNNASLISVTKQAYNDYLMKKTRASSSYMAMLDITAEKIAQINSEALSRVNDAMPWIYATSYNAIADENVRGYSFDIVDENTVKYLMTTDKLLVPQKHLNIRKDKIWNIKMMQSQVTRGILSGESINKIANRIQNVTNANENSAIRNARTMATSAENKGRLDSYKKAESDGVILTKVWIATGDNRTRDAHAELDGQEVNINEPFVNGLGEIMYPGDPDASSENVWMCRCSMMTDIKGFRR